MNFPATKRARIYKKPGVYLSGPLLGLPWRYAAVAELALRHQSFWHRSLTLTFPSVWSGAQFQRNRKRTISRGSYHTS